MKAFEIEIDRKAAARIPDFKEAVMRTADAVPGGPYYSKRFRGRPVVIVAVDNDRFDSKIKLLASYYFGSCRITELG